ncbi:hypothetical protein F5Y10DRAFT_238512 [Nemania abortiva]|nr:hypothetical protein F5Y10DRAFT_238512 [Nemania abortiva]
MIQKINSDAKRISDLELDLDDQKKSRVEYQTRARSLEIEIQHWQSRLNSGAFAVVLIDGDGAKFRDEFLRDHEQGAAKAAWKLKEAVKEAGLSHDMPILVRVYANVGDLARSLRMSGVIEYDESLHIFAEQFTNTHADCDFINVGKGKENADSKIRRLLDHYYKNAQCQMIFIACCHDNGYIHDLRRYAGDSETRLRLIETTPAEPNFRSLEIPILRFENVFRSEPLNNEIKRGAQTFPFRSRSPPQLNPGPIARPSQATLAPSESVSPEQEQRWPTPSTNSAVASPVQTTNTLATTPGERPQPVSSPQDKTPPQPQVSTRTSNVINSGNGGTSISYATAGGTADHQNVTVKLAKPKKQPKYAYYNDDKYRLDPPTQHPPRTPAQTTYQTKFQAIKPLVFCNDHYLKGRCKRGMNCDKEHEVELTPAEVAIHRYKARTSLCPQGPLCTDYDCYLSHHCPRPLCNRSDLCPFYHTANWGDLHYTKEQLQPATKWTEGVDFPEYL